MEGREEDGREREGEVVAPVFGRKLRLWGDCVCVQARSLAIYVYGRDGAT